MVRPGFQLTTKNPLTWHKAKHLPQNLHFKVHKVLRLPQNLHFKVHKVLHLPRNLHFTRSTKYCTCHEGQQESSAPATICENQPHVQNSRFTAPATKSEHAEDHHHVQSPAPATKSVHRHQSALISCACHEVGFRPPKHEVSLAPA